MKSIAIANAKGGVGKSFLATNLAIAFANTGAKTLLVDSNSNLPSMVQWHQVDDPIENLTAIRSSEEWPENSDFTVIDTAPNIDPETLSALSHANLLVLVTTSEPESIHGLIKTSEAVLLTGARPSLFIVTSQTLGSAAAARLGNSIERKLSRLLSVPVVAIMDIPYDPAVADMTIRRQHIVSQKPKSKVSVSIERLASILKAVEPTQVELALLPKLKVTPSLPVDKDA